MKKTTDSISLPSHIRKLVIFYLLPPQKGDYWYWVGYIGVWEMCCSTVKLHNTINGACAGGYFSLVKYLIEGKNGKEHIDVSTIASACISGNLKIVKYIKSLYTHYNTSTKVFISYYKSRICAIKDVPLSIVSYLIKLGYINKEHVLQFACGARNMKMASLMVFLGASNFWEGLTYAYNNKDQKMINYMTKKIDAVRDPQLCSKKLLKEKQFITI
jgi:hypothetical protein